MTTTASRPLLGGESRKVAISMAAWQLEDAMKDRHVGYYPACTEARELHFQAAQAGGEHSRALLVLVLLTLFETPSWCDNTSDFFIFQNPEIRCTVPGVNAEDLLLSTIPYIPPGLGVIIELAALFFIARKLLFERKLQTWYFDAIEKQHNVEKQYHDVKLIDVGLFMVCLEVLDCLVFILFRPHFRLAFVARTAFLCLIPPVMNLARCIFTIVGEVTTIAVFYLGTVLFFAWIATQVFDGVQGEVNGKPINHGLDTFGNSLNSLFVAGSTADFVFVFLPTYTAYRSSGILWFVFLIIVKVLLLSLVLDSLVAAYMQFNEETSDKMWEDKVAMIRQAFTILCRAETEKSANGDGEISKDVFLDFIQELCRSPGTRSLTNSDAEVVFQAVDKDHSELIDEKEFCDICGVLEYDFWVARKASILGEQAQRITKARPDPKDWPMWVRLFEWFKRQHSTPVPKDGEEIEDSSNFDKFMNIVLLFNLLLVFNESRYDVNGWAEPTSMDNLELIFSLVYVVEVALNLCVMSWGEYWSYRSYQFDFVITWLLLFSSVLDEIAASGACGDIKRYINILRLLRLGRVVKTSLKIKDVQTMISAISSIVAASKDILLLLFVAVLFYATLGVQLWGGLLYEGNKALKETEYDEKDWYILNFQDVPMAIGVWVVSLLSEYVQDFPQALRRVERFPGLSTAVFLSFYLFSVCIIFELVKAFTIEVFLSLKKMQKDTKGKGLTEFATLEEVKKEFDEKGEQLFYRTVGDPMRQVKMAEALEKMEQEIDGEEKGHRGSQEGSHH
jgi:hypothetical protein